MFERLKGDYTVEFSMFMHRLHRKLQKPGDIMKSMGVAKMLGLSPDSEAEMIKQADTMMKCFESVYNSMTKEERRKIHTLNGKRRQRIARGAGLNYSTTSVILDHFDNMRFLKF